MKIKAQTMTVDKAMKEDTLKTIWLKNLLTNVSSQNTQHHQIMKSHTLMMLRVATKR